MAGAALTSWNDDPPGRPSLQLRPMARPGSGPGRRSHRLPAGQRGRVISLTEPASRNALPGPAGGLRSDHPGGVNERHPLMEQDDT